MPELDAMTTSLPSSLPISSDERYRRLSALEGFRIGEGETDIRGFLVFAADGHRVGRVADLVVDTYHTHVRYLEVTLDPAFEQRDASRQTLIPIGCAHVAAHRKHVHVDDLASHEMRHAPRYAGVPAGMDEEARLHRFFRRRADRVRGGDPSLAREEQELRAFWGARRRGREARPYLVATADIGHPS